LFAFLDRQLLTLSQASQEYFRPYRTHLARQFTPLSPLQTPTPPQFDSLLSEYSQTMLTATTSAARSSLRHVARRAVPSSIRSYASEAEFSGGPTFNLTEEQNAIQDLARQFTVSFFDFVPYRFQLIWITMVKVNEIIPVAKEHDLTMKYPFEVIKKAHAEGLLNVHVPEAYGGAGENKATL